MNIKKKKKKKKKELKPQPQVKPQIHKRETIGKHFMQNWIKSRKYFSTHQY